MDLISQLPEALLHEILHLLPEKDAVRTCVLSTTWSRIQSRSPFLYFDEFDFPPQSLLGENTPEALLQDRRRKELFVEYVDQRLERLSQQDSPPLKLFMLSFIDFDPENDPPRIDLWLQRVCEKGVKCILLRHMGDNDVPICLPKCLLASQTLHELTLGDCSVDICGDIKIPNLQKLVLFNVNVDDDFIKHLISGCPLLENLYISLCDALTYIQANNLALLRRVVLRSCSCLRNVEILSPTVDCFEYRENRCSYSEESPKLILALSRNIKKITLAYANITSACLQQYIATCEDLVLTGIPGFESAKIHGKKVSKLTIESGSNMTKLPVIDCPNLHSLVYAQNKLPFHSVNISKLRNIRLEFNLEGKREWDVWLAELKGFFDNFKSKQELIMVVTSSNGCETQDVIIVDGLVELMLPVLLEVKGLMPKARVIISDSLEPIKKKSNSLELYKLVKDVFSYQYHVSFMALTVASAHISNSTFSQLLRMRADANCCKDQVLRCWRHYSCYLEKDNASSRTPAALKSYQSEQYQVTTILVEREQAPLTMLFRQTQCY